MAGEVSGAEARHRIANLLHTYTEIADRKDVDAGVDLLGGARVRFPAGGFESREGARPFFAQLWGSDIPHRHDVSNLVVEPADGGGWRAFAHYSRWIFQPEPLLHTLGAYELLVDAESWTISELTVTRIWTLADEVAR
jgi:hypothetical protein